MSDDEVQRLIALTRSESPGKYGTLTHDDKRDGTTTLFAALNTLDGTVIGRCRQSHRHQKSIQLLNIVERDVRAGKMIHTILDNYDARKHPKVIVWLERHPRWTFHFTPTSGSWLNAIEDFCSTMTRQRLKRRVFHSTVDLQTAIKRMFRTYHQAVVMIGCMDRQHEDVLPLVSPAVSNKGHRRLIYLRLYLATLVVFLPIDALWIALVMKPLFSHHVGDLLADQMHVAVALGFYAFYVAGIIYFAALPAWRDDSWRLAAINGGVLGLCAYGTYEATNMATLRGWSWTMFVTDVAWGALLTGVSAAVGFKMVRSFSSNAPSS